VLDQYLRICREHAQNATLLPFVPARDDLHGIVAPDINSNMCGTRYFWHIYQPLSVLADPGFNVSKLQCFKVLDSKLRLKP
jgi:hypothetical protein